MPRVRRIVEAGLVREVKDMFTGRIHTPGVTRRPRGEATGEAQKAANRKRLIEEIRWKLNANFVAGDLHTVFHYSGDIELEQADKNEKKILRLLREWCVRNGVKWKAAAVIEVKGKRGVNIHHHIILPDIPMSVMRELWERVVGEGKGTVTATALDRRGNHGKLAEYLLKYSDAADKMWRELGRRRHRISWARGMVTPKPRYIIISSGHWRKEPKARKGWILLKDDDGNVCREGYTEGGWPYREYFELKLE